MQAFFQASCSKDFTFQLDPMTFTTLKSDFGVPGIFGGSVTSRNVKLFGLSRSKVSSVNTAVSDNSLVINAKFLIPAMFFTAQAVSQMFLGILHTDFNGQFNLTMTDVDSELRIEGATEKASGVDFMRIKDVDFVPHPKTVTFYAAGVDQAYLDFLNQNWPNFYDQVLPDGRKLWNPLMRDFVNQIFATAPYRVFLPKS